MTRDKEIAIVVEAEFRDDKILRRQFSNFSHPDLKFLLDGYRVEQINLACKLRSKEDCQKLIEFLKIHAECFDTGLKSMLRKRSKEELEAARCPAYKYRLP